MTRNNFIVIQRDVQDKLLFTKIKDKQGNGMMVAYVAANTASKMSAEVARRHLVSQMEKKEEVKSSTSTNEPQSDVGGG